MLQPKRFNEIYTEALHQRSNAATRDFIHSRDPDEKTKLATELFELCLARSGLRLAPEVKK